jgi:hypothetical protein
MRTMLHVHMNTQHGNDAIKSGVLPKTIETLVAELHPEASYFFADGGRRSAIFVFDMADPSQIPTIAEPLFMGLQAELEFTPVMNLDDLQKGLTEVAKAF